MLDNENVTLPICKLTLQANIKVNHFCEWKPVIPRETYFTDNLNQSIPTMSMSQVKFQKKEARNESRMLPLTTRFIVIVLTGSVPTSN